MDWKQVTNLLAGVLFPDKRVAGRPRTWNLERYCELLDAVDRRKQKNPKLSELKVCEQIVKDENSPSYFRKAGANGLSKALQKARLPNHNNAWALVIDRPDGTLGKNEWDKVKVAMASDPKGAEARLLRRWREWKAANKS